MESYPNLRKIRAWSVHVYTALGLVCALLAANAIANHNIKGVLVFLFIAMFIDATDGALARRWAVKIWAASFDGRKLDDITDYINYAFLPMFFAWQFHLVSRTGGLIILGVALLAAVYGFCQTQAKTSDGYFTGWPNFWNITILYLYLFRAPAIASELVLLVCAILVFVPIKYVSFSTRPLHRLTRFMSFAYGVVMVVLLMNVGEPVEKALLLVSLAFPLYYIVLSLVLNINPDWQTHVSESVET
jgi:phosphatidylcholine synthase